MSAFVDPVDGAVHQDILGDFGIGSSGDFGTDPSHVRLAFESSQDAQAGALPPADGPAAKIQHFVVRRHGQFWRNVLKSR